ncbi:hypothetical protein D3C87_755620 [compost metagenome]
MQIVNKVLYLVMKQLPLGTILKTEKRFFEIVHLYDDGGYKISAMDDNDPYEMPIDEKVIHQGLENGTWEIFKEKASHF